MAIYHIYPEENRAALNWLEKPTVVQILLFVNEIKRVSL